MHVPPLVDALLEDWVLVLGLGLTVGGAAKILLPEKSYGITADCAAGLAGSIAGSCLAWAWSDYYRPGSFAMILSFFGAVVFIATLRKLNRLGVL
jgi:uncharacterized membrane protein YeaQ/YmgE (transglycosylase-associated protein family)